jgi:hypothetical protein
MLHIFALTENRAQLIAHRATTDDIEAARCLATLYANRGYIGRICQESTAGTPGDVLEEVNPA